MSENLYREVEKWPSRPFHFICADQLYVYTGNIGEEMGTRIISYMFINETTPVYIQYVYIYICVHIYSVYIVYTFTVCICSKQKQSIYQYNYRMLIRGQLQEHIY